MTKPDTILAWRLSRFIIGLWHYCTSYCCLPEAVNLGFQHIRYCISMSKSVRAGLAAALQSRAFADVAIKFHAELSAEEQQEREAAASNGSAGCAAAERLVGDSLPLHRYILALGSTYFEARFQNACWQGSAGVMPEDGALETRDYGEPGEHQAKRRKKDETQPPSRSPSKGGPEGCGAVVASALPEVLVPLSSEEEVPYAREAINYIYTGSLSEDLSFEALLRVRQQACYLGVKDGPQACDEAMVAWLKRQEQQGGSGATSTAAAALDRILDAYACHPLFPEAGTSPEAASFASVRAAISRGLGLHFRDAVKTLSKPESYQQLLQLPAGALKYLLSADNYIADSEDTVFLLLVCWLGANKDKEEDGAASLTTRDLRQLVHLEGLGRTYLYHVLPAFAPLQLTAVELALLLRYAELGSVEKEKSDEYFSFTFDASRAESRAAVRKQLLHVDALRQLLASSSRTPLRQVQERHTVYWTISGEQLEQGLRRMVHSKEKTWVSASFGESAAALGGCSDGTQALARGLLWGVKLELDPARLMQEAPGTADRHARPLGCWSQIPSSRVPAT